ncbi:MAG: siroheme synthase CysG [Pseudomonadota bacterium]
MKHFPIFLNLSGRRVVVSGGGEAALAKLRLLVKTEAWITVYTDAPHADLARLMQGPRRNVVARPIRPGDAFRASLVYGANEDADEDARVAEIARAEGALFNIVDNLADSQFITPAIVDRDPVTVAIGTEGAAPVLARAIKRDLEERLPTRLGLLAKIGKAFRPMAERLPFGRARRDFWSDYYFNAGPKAEDPKAALADLLDQHLTRDAAKGFVDFVGAGPGDPELLTLKARTALDKADVVIHDRLITPEILELARREALMIEAGKTGFGPAMAQDDINDLIVAHASKGAHVVRLKSGDATVFGRLDEEIEAVERSGLPWSIVPGITAASASVAALGQSLTRRGRNSGVELLTGHDMEGFADHDWRRLAAPGAVAGIYMGKRAARFVQGRLLMHGARTDTPVSVVENASRPDQRILATTLGQLPDDVQAADMAGPALMMLGLAPRAAAEIAPVEIKEFA